MDECFWIRINSFFFAVVDTTERVPTGGTACELPVGKGAGGTCETSWNSPKVRRCAGKELSRLALATPLVLFGV